MRDLATTTYVRTQDRQVRGTLQRAQEGEESKQERVCGNLTRKKDQEEHGWTQMQKKVAMTMMEEQDEDAI